MGNREKVIKGLEGVLDWLYEGDDSKCVAAYHAVEDALELLREQKPIEPKRTVNEHGQVFSCGKCGTWFEVQHQKYCHGCGKPVKWE